MELAIWQQENVANNQLIGCVMEFDVVLTSAATFQLRTTVSTGLGSPGVWDETPATDPGNHVRGYWPFSQLTMAAGSLDVKPVQGPPAVLIRQCVDKDGPEIAAFAQTAGDQFGTDRGNKGCFGANLLYDFIISNSGTTNNPLFVYAVARNVSTTNNALGFFGPVSILSPGAEPKLGIPSFRCSGPSPADGDVVRFLPQAASIPPTTATSPAITYRIGAAVAGAASTPFNLDFTTIAYTLTEPVG